MEYIIVNLDRNKEEDIFRGVISGIYKGMYKATRMDWELSILFTDYCRGLDRLHRNSSRVYMETEI